MSVFATYKTLERQLDKQIAEYLATYGVPTSMDEVYWFVEEFAPVMDSLRARAHYAARASLEAQASKFGMTLATPGMEDYPSWVLADAVKDMARLAPNSNRIAVELLDEDTKALVTRRVHITKELAHEPVVVQRVASDLARRLGRHAADAGRRTFANAALSHKGRGEQVGYARVLTGRENCAFCAMLASRGPVYKESTVVDKARGGKYHDGCDCVQVLVVKGKPWVGEREYEKLENLWGDVRGDETSSEDWKNWREFVESGGFRAADYSPFA